MLCSSGWQVHRVRSRPDKRQREHGLKEFQGMEIKRILPTLTPAFNTIVRPVASGTSEILELKDREFVTIFCNYGIADMQFGPSSKQVVINELLKTTLFF